IRVGEYTSRILLVTDFSSRIPVMGSQSGDRALLVGNGGAGAVLEEPETPDRIVEGEMWVTSGDDGQMPLGVRVGVARRTPEGWRIDLTMHEGAVDFLRLIPPPAFAAPEVAPPLKPGSQEILSEALVAAAAPVAGVPAASRPETAPDGAAPPGQGGE